MADQLDHIAWRRLPSTAPRKTRPYFPSRAFRANVPAHGTRLSQNIAEEIRASGEDHEAVGVDPSRLMVLRFRFLEKAEREHLDKLGLQILSEREEQVPLAQPRYAVPVKFSSADAKREFLEQRTPQPGGLTGVQEVRASSGAADPLRLKLEFEDLAAGKAFLGDSGWRTALALTPTTKAPAKVSKTTVYSLLTQVPDDAHRRQFEAELSAYRGVPSMVPAILTANQRRELFDSLEGVDRPSPAERRGARLRAAHAPLPAVAYYDVDLWHPGSAALVAEVIRQFATVVRSGGGEVTDSPTSVADTLLLARVKGPPKLVEMLLRYEQAARIDLPTEPPEVQFTIFDRPAPQPEAVQIEDDGPLACVVDSGVVSAHPLLRGLVVDERDFSGEGTTVDQAGHGTHVAGIVAYGDVYQCLQSNQWRPRVRLLSAKVMRLVEQRDLAGEVWAARSGFEETARPERLIKEAITAVVQSSACRVFNLSIGDDAQVLDRQSQLPWACVLDELARALDVVLVVSAGNVSNPSIPAARTAPEFQAAVREQIFDPASAIIDPASAINALTVGSLARTDTPFRTFPSPGRRPDLVGSPVDCPSPFTRAGTLDGTGRGVRRAVKPEVVAYGGNYSLGVGGRAWNRNDPGLGVPSLRHDFQAGRLLSVACGTSSAAPYAAHVCALVEHRLRRLRQRRPTANLIRALAVHSARVPPAAEDWVTSGQSNADGEQRCLRVMGYGLPDAERAMYSADNRVVLLSEDEIVEDQVHLYEVELPPDFVQQKGRRAIRITLAYDPPIRGTRREYMGRNMWFQLYRGCTAEEILRAAAAAEGSGEPPASIESVKARPPYTLLQWSTVQSALFEAAQARALNYGVGDDGAILWHVLVGCTGRFPIEPVGAQRYALVLSLEHSDEKIRLHQVVRTRVAQRVRLRWPGPG